MRKFLALRPPLINFEMQSRFLGIGRIIIVQGFFQPSFEKNIVDKVSATTTTTTATTTTTMTTTMTTAMTMTTTMTMATKMTKMMTTTTTMTSMKMVCVAKNI